MSTISVFDKILLIIIISHLRELMDCGDLYGLWNTRFSQLSWSRQDEGTEMRLNFLITINLFPLATVTLAESHVL